MTSTKSREPIAAADVPRIFDDACIDTLAVIGRLRVGADRKRFAEGVREAARIYARDAREPTDNELHAEIHKLYRAAERKRYELIADLLERLSPKARHCWTRAGRGQALASDCHVPKRCAPWRNGRKPAQRSQRSANMGAAMSKVADALLAGAQNNGVSCFMRRSLAASSRSGTRSEVL